MERSGLMMHTMQGKPKFTASATPADGVRPFVLTCVILLMVCAEGFAQKPLLSPRDSVGMSSVAGTIMIDYGRPSMRGRTIMGGLVPYDRWWRTGANEATSLRTDADLLFGEHLVPVGSYTLYTLPSEREWTLIVNTQTGQWGTIYNPDLDLVRIPMQRRLMSSPLEIFTITLERHGPEEGILRLRWETTDVFVPFRIISTTEDPE